MAWIIASVPFWILGAAFFVAGVVWFLDATETRSDRAGYFLGSMLIACPFFLIAAWISS